MKTLSDIKELKGKRVLVRVDFNIPVENGIILDDFRIKKTLPTIEKLRNQGAKVILMSHFKNNGDDSLKPVWRYLRTFFPVSFIEDIFSEDSKKTVDGMANAEVVLLENLRHWKEEKENEIGRAHV